MRDLMVTIGELLLLWGYLENAIRKRVSSIKPGDLNHSRGPLLMSWREAEKARCLDDTKLTQLFFDIEKVADVRNCIAHGLKSASANPWSGEEPTVVCATPAGDDRSITMSEMTDVKKRLHLLTNQIRDL